MCVPLKTMQQGQSSKMHSTVCIKQYYTKLELQSLSNGTPENVACVSVHNNTNTLMK